MSELNAMLGFLLKIEVFMVIVRFVDGKYGIRCGFFNKKYIDLNQPIYKWPKGHMFFNDCRGTFDEVKKVYDACFAGEVIVNTNTGEPIK